MRFLMFLLNYLHFLGNGYLFHPRWLQLRRFLNILCLQMVFPFYILQSLYMILYEVFILFGLIRSHFDIFVITLLGLSQLFSKT